MRRKQKRVSHGIVLFKFEKNIPEVLLIKSRYSYYFADFVNMKFVPPEFNVLRPTEFPPNTEKNLIYMDKKIRTLLSKMSVNELLDIKTCDYRYRIWARIWRTKMMEQNDLKRLDAFYKFFTSEEYFPKNYLSKVVDETFAISKERWGFPKGHSEFNESSIQAALREFEEEVGLKSSDIRLLPYKSYKNIFSDMGVYYEEKLFAFEYIGTDKLKIHMKNDLQIAEIDCLAWVNVKEAQLPFIDSTKRIKNAIKHFLKQKSRIRNSPIS